MNKLWKIGETACCAGFQKYPEGVFGGVLRIFFIELRITNSYMVSFYCCRGLFSKPAAWDCLDAYHGPSASLAVLGFVWNVY